MRDNVIRNNGAVGVVVFENSVARIGFTENSAAEPSPNVIEGNGLFGIWVTRSSHADIAANLIRNNNGDGIAVDGSSHAVARNNDISSNTGSAISATLGSGITLGAGSSTGAWRNRPNFSTSPNGNFGLLCSIGGFTGGRLGGLSGVLGAKSIANGCIDTVQ